jgi:hypothetical protein
MIARCDRYLTRTTTASAGDIRALALRTYNRPWLSFFLATLQHVRTATIEVSGTIKYRSSERSLPYSYSAGSGRNTSSPTLNRVTNSPTLTTSQKSESSFAESGSAIMPNEVFFSKIFKITLENVALSSIAYPFQLFCQFLDGMYHNVNAIVTAYIAHSFLLRYAEQSTVTRLALHF